MACVGSLNAVLRLAILALMIGTVCVARVALAEPAPLRSADFEGRWVSREKKLTLDVSRCGDEWCGVIVENNACGHTALRVGRTARDNGTFEALGRLEFTGQLLLAANTQPYGVLTTLSRDKNGLAVLFVAGHSGGAFQAFRRTYDYRDLMARDGEATCRADPKQS